MTNILICEDSLTGILTGIYRAYEWKLKPEDTVIQIGEEGNLVLFAEYTHIEPDEDAAFKVIRSIKRILGESVAYDLETALLSDDMTKGNAVYHTIVLALDDKKTRVMECLQNDYVRKVFELSRRVGNEIHHLLGFLRFEELENGVLCAVVSPKSNIITRLAPHFTDRFPLENFVICDEKRGLVVVHPKKRGWFVTEGAAEMFATIDRSSKEEYIQSLFKHFVDTIAIESRRNESLQRNMLPLRFRPYMTEFKC